MLSVHQFALWFSDADVKFMIRRSNNSDWSTLHRLPFGALDFQDEMQRFCDQVRQDCNGDTSVILLLPADDIHCGSVSVIGRKQAARDLHVRRTLARQVADQAGNIVAHFGEVDALKIAPVCYAKQETLRRAERFVRGFGFQVACFSTMSEHGLDCEPCLMLPHQAERLRRVNAVPKVSYAFRGAAAAMVAASAIIGTNIHEPNSAMMARILDAGNVPGQPVQVALHIAGFENSGTASSIEASAVAPRFEQKRAQSKPTNLSLAALSGAVKSQASPIRVAALSSQRILPSTHSANQMDAIVAHQGGFHVYVGVLGNLTHMAAGGEHSTAGGQVVFIQKPVNTFRKIARVVEARQIALATPVQFNLTEMELASFSRP